MFWFHEGILCSYALCLHYLLADIKKLGYCKFHTSFLFLILLMALFFIGNFLYDALLCYFNLWRKVLSLIYILDRSPSWASQLYIFQFWLFSWFFSEIWNFLIKRVPSFLWQPFKKFFTEDYFLRFQYSLFFKVNW